VAAAGRAGCRTCGATSGTGGATCGTGAATSDLGRAVCGAGGACGSGGSAGGWRTAAGGGCGGWSGGAVSPLRTASVGGRRRPSFFRATVRGRDRTRAGSRGTPVRERFIASGYI